jgi:hypothetical protein
MYMCIPGLSVTFDAGVLEFMGGGFDLCRLKKVSVRAFRLIAANGTENLDLVSNEPGRDWRCITGLSVTTDHQVIRAPHCIMAAIGIGGM